MNDQAGEPSVAQLRRRVAELEAQLARSQQAEADQRRINSSLPVLVATAGVDGYYKEVNAAFVRILGWSEQASLSRPIWEFVHPDDRAAHDENFERLKSGDPAINFRERHFCKDGSHRWISWTVIPVPDRDIVFGVGHDITEKQQAEDELRRSEARWSSVIGNAPVFVALLDAADRIQFLNHAAPGMTVHDAIGRSVYDFIQPAFRETARSCIERVRCTGEIADYETLAAGPDDRLSWYETHVGPIKVDDELVGVTLMSIDVTERKRAQDAIRQSEQRLRLHVEQTPLAVIEWDLELRVTKWNPGAERIFGYTEEESLGRHFAFLIPPEVREHAELSWAALRAKRGGERSTNENVTKGGSTILCDWYNTPLVNAEGGVIGFASLADDITERKQAPMKLQESEERFRRVFDEGPIGVALVDLDLRFRNVNRRLCETLGYSEEEIIELGIRGITHPDDLEPGLQFAVRLFRGEISPFSMEKRYLRKGGQAIWGALTVSVVHDAEGKPMYGIAMIEDITERKRAEEELARNRAMLRATIDSLPFDFFAFGPDGHYTMQNANAERTVGHLIGKRPEEVCPDEHTLSIWLDNNRRAFAGEKVEGEIAFAVQGECRSFHNVIVPIRDGSQICGILGVNVDITERKRVESALRQAHDELEARVKERTAELQEANEQLRREVEERRQAEEALRASEEETRSLVEFLPIGVTAICDRRIVYANDAAVRLYGAQNAADLVGMDVSDAVPADRRAVLRDDLEQLVSGAGIVSSHEGAIRRLDGTRLDVDVGGTPFRYDGRSATLHVFRDITERKQAEEKVKREQQALRRMVLATDNERRLVTYELHDGVAQQLLGAKMLFESQQPSKGRKSKTAETYRDAMEALRRATSELRRVMNRMRTPVLDRFGLVEAIKDVASQLRSTAGAPEIDYHPDVRFERLEPTLENSLFRIAQEGMTNACRYSQSEKVRVTLTQEGDEVTLEVRDWGVGFDQAAVQENHFGLEGIRERSRLLGGKLNVESEPGQGTVVRVTLPVIEAAEEDE